MTETELETILKSIVKILGPKKDEVSGTGFIIRKDGYIITCHHVIFNLDRLMIEYDGKKFEAEWCQEYSHPDVDVSILKINADNTEPIQLIDPKDLRSLKTHIIICGFPHSTLDWNPKGTAFYPKELIKDTPIKTILTYNSANPKYNNPWNRLPKKDAHFNPFKIHENVTEGVSGGPVFINSLDGAIGLVQSMDGENTYAIRWDNITDDLMALGIAPKNLLSNSKPGKKKETKKPIAEIIFDIDMHVIAASNLTQSKILEYSIDVFSDYKADLKNYEGLKLSPKTQEVAKQKLETLTTFSPDDKLYQVYTGLGPVCRAVIDSALMDTSRHIKNLIPKEWYEIVSYLDSTIFKGLTLPGHEKHPYFGSFTLRRQNHQRMRKPHALSILGDPLSFYSYQSDGFWGALRIMSVYTGNTVKDQTLKYLPQEEISYERAEEVYEHIVTKIHVKDRKEFLKHRKLNYDETCELLTQFLMGDTHDESDLRRVLLEITTGDKGTGIYTYR